VVLLYSGFEEDRQLRVAKLEESPNSTEQNAG
jgi:hypothetical protein